MLFRNFLRCESDLFDLVVMNSICATSFQSERSLHAVFTFFHVTPLTHHVKTAMRLILCQVPVILPSNFQNILLHWILDLFIMSIGFVHNKCSSLFGTVVVHHYVYVMRIEYKYFKSSPMSGRAKGSSGLLQTTQCMSLLYGSLTFQYGSHRFITFVLYYHVVQANVTFFNSYHQYLLKRNPCMGIGMFNTLISAFHVQISAFYNGEILKQLVFFPRFF